MKKFYLGMDIGTDSVGMACTDEEYNLLRAKGKDCWAVRLFNPSSTAEKRRSFRTARRRLERRKQRIGFLQALFEPFIEDENFFLRLNNSAYFPEDKASVLGGDKNSLFADGIYCDKNYHSDYPTIYHLRYDLQSKPVKDIRLYYLALHHIIKYRGHFLLDGGIENVHDIYRLFDELSAVCAEIFTDYERVPQFDSVFAEQAKNILIDGKTGLRDKQNALEALFGKDALTKEIIKGITGGKLSPKNLFGEEYETQKSFTFKDLTDETFDGMEADFGDNFILLEKIKAIYSFALFEKLFEGQPNISAAMINLYNTHKNDLRCLKQFLRGNAGEEVYRKFFKSTKEKANYVNYVGYTKKGGDKIKVKHCSDGDFFAELKKLITGIENVTDTEIRDDILSKINSGTFLPKILHSDNGLFPHQVNQQELEKIVENMVKVHPETHEIADKILKVFLFKIPYYVGPLTGKNSWAVRTDEKITPWNFDTVVDKAQSNENFMRRMTNKCTYLRGEDVLPQASVFYQKFNVLNQLNKLKINDTPISVELKQKLFDDVFKVKNKVTDKTIINFLVREGAISEYQTQEVKITGKDSEIKANMSSYIRLKQILGSFVDDDLMSGGGVCENIILWHTLNTDKNIVEKLIEKNYGKIRVIKDNIKSLKGLTFQKFGRLSMKFLTGLKVNDPPVGENLSILDLMYFTNQNLNEILFNEKYGFEEIIKKENGETDSEIRYKDLENLYVSPAVRRGIWQSLRMADEYILNIGRAPDKIFVEVTREEGTKGAAGRTVSRKNRLLELYKNVAGYDEIRSELTSEGLTDLRLRQERLYLYFRQLGRCMYSGERIDLSQLNTDMYDVDHILPRTYIKDDSLDNKALVLRKKNVEKRDAYPLPQGFTEQQNFWKMLLTKGLISDVTYGRLTRTEPLNEDDYSGFINRQKVITDQTAKAVAELLKRKYSSTKIVYSKAKNVNDFKSKFDLFKCRETNDLHHARDAYLNVVVGNVFDTCFSSPMAMFRNDGDRWRMYNLKTMFFRDVDGAWNGGSLSVVKSVFAKCSMCVTKYSYCVKGEFYNQTVYSNNDSRSKIPRKGNGVLGNIQKYGGYSGLNTAYFAVVQSEDKKGKIIKSIEAVPVLIQQQTNGDVDRLKEYFEEKGLKNAEILVPKIKINQLVSFKGMPVYITGISGIRILVQNAVELFTDNKTDEYVKALMEFYERYKSKIDEESSEVYIIKTNRMGEIKLKISKENNLSLYNFLVGKLDDKIYSGIGYCATYQKILKDGLDKFKCLTTAKQVKVLLQALNFFRCNAMLSDLSLIGGNTLNGKLSFSKYITEDDFKIIYKSNCGLTLKERKV